MCIRDRVLAEQAAGYQPGDRWVYSLGASGADGVFTVQATVCTLNSDGTLTLETYLLG